MQSARGVRLLSLRKPTSQVNTGWGGRSSRAVDGNTDGRYGRRSCTHTHRRRHAWWRVDLRHTYAIQRVVVYNRRDCCASRLNNFEVRVNNHRCGVVHRAHAVNTVNCRNRRGRYVKVQKRDTNYLTLCEVKVYGSSSKLRVSAKRKAFASAQKRFVTKRFVKNKFVKSVRARFIKIIVQTW